MWKSRRDGTTSTLARPRRGQTTVTAGLDLRIATTPSLARPRRGQTTVTAGLDLRIATTSSHSHDPNGVARRGKGKSFYVCDLSEVGSILGGSTTRRSRPAVMQMRPLRGQWETKHGAAAPLHAPQGPYTARQRPSTPRRGLTRCDSSLTRPKGLTRAEGTFNGAAAPFPAC